MQINLLSVVVFPNFSPQVLLKSILSRLALHSIKSTTLLFSPCRKNCHSIWMRHNIQTKNKRWKIKSIKSNSFFSKNKKILNLQVPQEAALSRMYLKKRRKGPLPATFQSQTSSQKRTYQQSQTHHPTKTHFSYKNLWNRE